MTASTLLAALIAASTATNGVITVGDTQPFDQVRLYQNPANDTVLTNQSSDGSIDTSTTALVITGSTAPTGLVFEPNLSVLRNVTSDIKLLVDTPVELTLTLNLAGTMTQMTVEAGNTAVLTLGLIAGIPMIVGAFGFFPVASPSTPAETGLLLVPAGATESVDGDYQRFVPNATDPLGYPAYYAELYPTDLHSGEIQVHFKWPALTVVNDALVIFFSSGNYDSIENPVGDETDSIYAALQLARTEGSGQGDPYNIANFNFYKFGVEPPTSEPVTLTPSAGDIATLTFTRTQMRLTVGGETQSYAIRAGTFTGVPLLTVVAKVESAVLPLSIKVTGA